MLEGCTSASRSREDILPLNRARPHGRGQQLSRRDWAVFLPTLLTVCVLAYAGHQATAAHSRANVSPAAVGSLRAAIPPDTGHIVFRESPSSVISERKLHDDSVGGPADIIALTEPLVQRIAARESEASVPAVVLRRTSRDLSQSQDIIEVQDRLAELGYLSVKSTGAWGQLSKLALEAFKEANRLPPDGSWDDSTEQSLFSSAAEPAPAFVGAWAGDVRACSKRARQDGLLPTIIEISGARAGEASCLFHKRRQVATGWNVAATCSDGQERWTANIQLAVSEGRLTWASERGTQTYIKCQGTPPSR
jgi:hypothetical protein